jgi:hypothetical protein
MTSIVKMQYVWLANKKRDEEQDLMQKNKVIRVLKEKFGIIALGLIPNVYLRDRESNQVQIVTNFEGESKLDIYNKYEINLPDLYIKNSKNPILIEIDGPIHGYDDDVSRSQQTKLRNDNYSKGGFTEDRGNLVIISSDDVINHDDDDLAQILKNKLGII